MAKRLDSACSFRMQKLQERSAADLDWRELAGLPVAWTGRREALARPYPFVILTRVHTYRNFAGFPFTVSATPSICAAIADKALNLLSKQGGYDVFRLSDCAPPVIRMLRERLLLPERSVPFPGKKEFKYLNVDAAAKRWVLVNEVEHMMFGRMYSGCLTEKDFIEDYASPDSHQPWAWSERLGYLTSAPDHLGPGLEMEMLVHLPGHALARQLPQARNSMVALGLGFAPVSFSEGSAEAGLFLVKSRGNAGESLPGIYTRFMRNVQSLLIQEKKLQDRCMEKHHKTLEVRVQDSLEGLEKAEVLSYPSLLKMGSNLRLGAYLGLLNPKLAEIAEELRVTTGSGHLGVSSNRLLSKEDEDRYRAKVVRLALESSKI